MISFIMPAKNTAGFIADALNAVVSQPSSDWEVIVIDDHSEDDTFEIVRHFSDADGRIKIYKNPGRGKVCALNYGYALSRGSVIKCIDSDDLLADNFLSLLPALSDNEAHCHSACIVDMDLNPITDYQIHNAIIMKDYAAVREKLVSIPRWSWTFARSIADQVFPMPQDLPFEDVWFSLIIKKYAAKILFSKTPMYLYRQHVGQTFGGILNYKPDIIRFRANRMLNLIEVLCKQPQIMHKKEIEIFSFATEYYKLLLCEPLTFYKVMHAKLDMTSKVKILLIRKSPLLASYATRLKWKVDRLMPFCHSHG